MAASRLTRQEITRRIRAGVRQVRSDVAGIIVFGSFARGGDYRDVDLLVAVEHLDEPPLERKGDVQALRQRIDVSLPVDLLLVSTEERRAGFQAHLPLFLDIAFDGQVLYDTGVLHRAPTGGWRFPVTSRGSTVL